MICPNEPTGNSSLASWCRKLVRWCRSLELQSGVGYRVNKGTNGTTLELEHTPAGKAAGTATRYRVKSVQGDYMTCHAMDGTNESSDDVFVAKPPHLRHSVTSQAVDGITVDYSSYTISGGICKRLATATGYDQQEEMVVPVYQLGILADAEILAVEPIGGTGVSAEGEAVTWLDINIDARAWCHPKVEDEVTSASG